MNLYKKRILKSEEVRLVTGAAAKREGAEEIPGASGSSSNAFSDTRVPIEEAYARGLAEGKALGRKEAEKELNRVLNSLKQALGEVSRLRSEIFKNAEREVVTLALAIAEKIVHQELSINREAVQAIFRAAVEAIGEKEKLLVRCHPNDLQALEGYLKDLQASQGGLGEVEFVADAGLLQGGLKIEAAFCEVDATLEARLAVMKKIIGS